MKNDKTLEVSKMLTLSIAHVTFKTADLIAKDSIQNHFPCLEIYDKDDYGWFIYFDPAELTEARNTLPADLMACIDLAVDNDCSILCLDQDGTECELPTYDWDNEGAEPVAVLCGEKNKSNAGHESIENVSYNRFCWFWLASHGFSVKDLVVAVADCIDEISDRYETVGAEDLCAFVETYYLTGHNLDAAQEELYSTSVAYFIMKVVECANVHLLGIEEDVDADEVIDMFEDTGLGQGRLYPCMDEFLGAEYQDAKLIRQLLNDQEYAEYLTL